MRLGMMTAAFLAIPGVISGCSDSDALRRRFFRDAGRSTVDDAGGPILNRDGGLDGESEVDGGLAVGDGALVDGGVVEDTGGVIEDAGGVRPPPEGEASCVNLLPGEFDCTVDGRDVHVHVPDLYDGTVAVPLVIDMHGYTSNNGAQQALSGWDDLADVEGFIVAYPQGMGNSWNAQGQCCGFSNANDVRFIRDIVADIEEHAYVDSARIYATGLSNGGSMTHTLACEAADVFAAASAVSFGLSGGGNLSAIVANCRPDRGIPVIHFHGTSDGLVLYDSGVLDSLGARDSLEAWRQIQGCNGDLVTEELSDNTSCEAYGDCREGVEVRLCTVTGGSHVLYPDVDGAGIARFSWDFFQRF